MGLTDMGSEEWTGSESYPMVESCISDIEPLGSTTGIRKLDNTKNTVSITPSP
jgi:hypothetical protein